MAIPQFRKDGWLPEGHHPATWEEIEERFGGEPDSRRRILLQRLLDWRDALSDHGIKGLVILDGSFASAKETPGDIDAIFVSDVDSMEILATSPAAARLVNYVWLKDNGFGDVFYFAETTVRDFPSLCRLDGFDVDTRSGVAKGVIEVRI